AAPSAATAAEFEAATLRFSGAGADRQNLRRVDVDQLGRDVDDCLGITLADSTQTVFPQAVAAATHADVLIVAPELGDGAGDDGADSQNASDFCRGVGINAVAVGEILFFKNLVER